VTAITTVGTMTAKEFGQRLYRLVDLNFVVDVGFSVHGVTITVVDPAGLSGRFGPGELDLILEAESWAKARLAEALNRFSAFLASAAEFTGNDAIRALAADVDPDAVRALASARRERVST